MKVLCIDEEFYDSKGRKATKQPHWGDIDLVVRDVKHHLPDGSDHLFYLLIRFPNVAFSCENFIPLSDLDETELVNKNINHAE